MNNVDLLINIELKSTITITILVRTFPISQEGADNYTVVVSVRMKFDVLVAIVRTWVGASVTVT